MDEFRQFRNWLLARPSIKGTNYRLPIPRFISQLFFYVCFLAGFYGLSKISPDYTERQRLDLVVRNGWTLAAVGLFFFSLLINDYLNGRFPPKGFLARFGMGARPEDPGNPVVRLSYIVGPCCLICFAVGFFKTWGLSH